MSSIKKHSRNPWTWIPSLYFAEGLPFVIVMTVSVVMYKRLGISNTEIALYTSWLYLPWVIKPLWSPLVDILRTKRFWIITMQLIIGAGLAGVALTIPAANFFRYTLAFFWLLAFSSATHDISADGFYMLGLTKHQQAFFVGVRSTFYRFAMITGQGLLVILAGYIETTTGLPPVEISVVTTTNKTINQLIKPDSIFNLPAEDNFKLVFNTNLLEINNSKITKEDFDSTLSFVKNRNHENGFYPKEEIQKDIDTEQSWWDKTIGYYWDNYFVKNLENFLRENFGPGKIIKQQNELTGNIGLNYFHLSKQPLPGEEIVVNFGQKSGDPSINLIEGKRFVINDSNWNKPAYVLFQLDEKLTKNTEALFEARAGNIPLSWVVTFFILTLLFVMFFIYHRFILPYPKEDHKQIASDKNVWKEFFRTFALFFNKKKILIIIAFLLLYRLGEAQLAKLAPPFLLDTREVGGLGLTTGDYGLVYGTIGIISLVLGGLLGGFLAARHGLKFWLWWMLIAINLPNSVYIFLSHVLPESLFVVSLSVAIEQFGYGFGFTAYILYMIYISEGEHKTAHYAIATGFMALGMMLPGMISGWLQEILGYQHFFLWVVIATIPAFFITKFIDLDPDFGKKVDKP